MAGTLGVPLDPVWSDAGVDTTADVTKTTLPLPSVDWYMLVKVTGARYVDDDDVEGVGLGAITFVVVIVWLSMVVVEVTVFGSGVGPGVGPLHGA